MLTFYGPTGGVKGQQKANFENENFSIVISDLDSLRKSMIANWFSFFFIMGVSTSQLAKTAKFWLDALFLQISTFFLILTLLSLKYGKMKTTLHSNFFARSLNL